MTNDSDTDGEEAKELGKSLRRPDVKIAHNTDRRNGKKGGGRWWGSSRVLRCVSTLCTTPRATSQRLRFRLLLEVCEMCGVLEAFVDALA